MHVNYQCVLFLLWWVVIALRCFQFNLVVPYNLQSRVHGAMEARMALLLLQLILSHGFSVSLSPYVSIFYICAGWPVLPIHHKTTSLRMSVFSSL